MWLPSRVETKHKTRACLVWSTLVAMLVGYTVWVVYWAVKKRENPNVSLTVEEDAYKFPDVSVCFVKGYGCDTEDASKCVESAQDSHYAHSATPVVGFNHSNDGTDDITGSVNNKDFPHCLEFGISAFNLSTEATLHQEEPRIRLALEWEADLQDDHDDDSNTFFSESVYVYMYHPLDGEEGGLQNEIHATVIPYTRITNISSADELVRVEYTTVNIGLTETKKLSGSHEWHYTPTSISHAFFDNRYRNIHDASDAEMDNNTYRGLLFMDLQQPALSHTVLKEVEPVEIATIIGSIGGAWELLLIVWGLIFIANQRQEPDLKGRNFVKAARRGKDEVTRRTRRYFVARSGESRETVATANDEHEVRPTWDTGSNTGLQPKPEQAKQSRWTPQNKPDLLHWRQFHQQPEFTVETTEDIGGPPSFHVHQESGNVHQDNQSPNIEIGLEPSHKKPHAVHTPCDAGRPFG